MRKMSDDDHFQYQSHMLQIVILEMDHNVTNLNLKPHRKKMYPSILFISMSFLGGSVDKEFTCDAGDVCLIPGLGRSPGGGHGNPLPLLAWRISMDRGAWRAIVHRVAESQTQPKD